MTSAGLEHSAHPSPASVTARGVALCAHPPRSTDERAEHYKVTAEHARENARRSYTVSESVSPYLREFTFPKIPQGPRCQANWVKVETIDGVPSKRCTLCHEVKPLDAFSRHRARGAPAGGRASRCRSCCATLARNTVTREEAAKRMTNAELIAAFKAARSARARSVLLAEIQSRLLRPE
jgi:hypothetical protein